MYRPRQDNRELRRYLLPNEQLVISIRDHWIVIAKPVAIGVAATALIIYLDATVPASAGPMMEVLWALWLGAIGWVLWQVFTWRHTRFVATDKRLLKFHGFVIRKVSMMPLTKLTDMTYHRSVLGRLLGYGKFVLESAGQNQALQEVDHVPHPDENYRAIVAQLFGPGGRDVEDELPEEYEGEEPDTDELPVYDAAAWTEAEYEAQLQRVVNRPSRRLFRDRRNRIEADTTDPRYYHGDPAPYDRQAPRHDPDRW